MSTSRVSTSRVVDVSSCGLQWDGRLNMRFKKFQHNILFQKPLSYEQGEDVETKKKHKSKKEKTRVSCPAGRVPLANTVPLVHC